MRRLDTHPAQTIDRMLLRRGHLSALREADFLVAQLGRAAFTSSCDYKMGTKICRCFGDSNQTMVLPFLADWVLGPGSLKHGILVWMR